MKFYRSLTLIVFLLTLIAFYVEAQDALDGIHQSDIGDYVQSDSVDPNNSQINESLPKIFDSPFPHWLTSILTGVLAGIIASITFSLFLFRLRPRIDISPWIAHEVDEKGDFFVFKIVNKSRRPAINVRVDLSLAKGVQVEGGLNYWTSAVPVVKPVIFELAGHKNGDSDGDYAQRFVTRSNISKIWHGDNTILRFRVIATDSFSGFSRAYKVEYRVKRNCVKNGSHEFGHSMKVS